MAAIQQAGLQRVWAYFLPHTFSAVAVYCLVVIGLLFSLANVELAAAEEPITCRRLYAYWLFHNFSAHLTGAQGQTSDLCATGTGFVQTSAGLRPLRSGSESATLFTKPCALNWFGLLCSFPANRSELKVTTQWCRLACAINRLQGQGSSGHQT